MTSRLSWPFMAAVLLLLAAGTAGADSVARYHVSLPGPDTAELVRLLEGEGIDVAGSDPGAGSVDVVVSASQLRQLHALGLEPCVTAATGPIAPEGYLGFGAIRDSMLAWQRAFPTIALMVDVGQATGTGTTFEGRPLLAMKISDNVADEEDEPAILIVSGHHAREIITPELALSYIEKLVTRYGKDPDVTRWIDENEIWVAPLWNPDGYEHCLTVDGSWRKNRRPRGTGAFGVDLNRNYPYGWYGPFAGSTLAGSQTYKGPVPASEEETQIMMAWALDRRFAKCLDFHSYGREVIFGYYSSRSLPPALEVWMSVKATQLSTALGYGGWTRKPSAEGEHYQWELNELGSFAFLAETGSSFLPPIGEAEAEAALTWPGVKWFLDHEIPLKGHIREAGTGAPLTADIDIVGMRYPENDIRRSGGPHGRFHYFLPPGDYDVTISAQGYAPRTVKVSVESGRSATLETQLGNAPALTVSGIVEPGATLDLAFDWPAGAGQHYVNGIAWNVGGFELSNGMSFPLSPDSLLQSTIGALPGWVGTLDESGHAAATLTIPEDPGLKGRTFHMAYFTYADDWENPTAVSAAVKLEVE